MANEEANNAKGSRSSNSFSASVESEVKEADVIEFIQTRSKPESQQECANDPELEIYKESSAPAHQSASKESSKKHK